MIDRATASGIALQEIRARGLGSGVRSIHLAEELGTMAPAIYGGPPLSRCWIAYIDRENAAFSIQSSTVVLIDHATGAVLFAGSANDEG